MDKIDVFVENRRFAYSIATVCLCCVFWWIMKFDASTLKDVINGVSIGFLASEAATAFAKK